jgi:Zn-dependent protease
MLNIFLAIFNMVPIPPLDGSKILPKFLPFAWQLKYQRFRAIFEQNTLIAFGVIILLFITVLGQPLAQLTFFLAQLLVG